MKFKIGDKVKIIGHKGGTFHNHKIGDIGKVTSLSRISCLVVVGRVTQYVNFSDLKKVKVRKSNNP